MNTEQELALIKNCQEGRPEQFALIYDEYISRIYRFVFYKTQHKETAEDLTSTVFIKALENIKKFNPTTASFSVWIYSIARNTVIDYYRTRKDSVNIEDVLDLAQEGPEIPEKIDLESKIMKVQGYLKKLTPEQREIVVLRLWEGLSHREIAQVIGKTENNTKVIFSRVMSELRKEFGPLVVLLLLSVTNFR